jgi:hypothetical protein
MILLSGDLLNIMGIGDKSISKSTPYPFHIGRGYGVLLEMSFSFFFQKHMDGLFFIMQACCEFISICKWSI